MYPTVNTVSLFLIFWLGLSDIRINCNRIGEGLTVVDFFILCVCFVSGLENREYCRRDPRDTLYPQELAPTSLTSGGRSVCIVRSRTKATEFACLFCVLETQFCFCACLVRPPHHLLSKMRHPTYKQTVLTQAWKFGRGSRRGPKPRTAAVISCRYSVRTCRSVCKRTPLTQVHIVR
jgi:hypothetical protein